MQVFSTYAYILLHRNYNDMNKAGEYCYPAKWMAQQAVFAAVGHRVEWVKIAGSKNATPRPRVWQARDEDNIFTLREIPVTVERWNLKHWG